MQTHVDNYLDKRRLQYIQCCKLHKFVLLGAVTIIAKNSQCLELLLQLVKDVLLKRVLKTISPGTERLFENHYLLLK
jgi:hypothetical protein